MLVYQLQTIADTKDGNIEEEDVWVTLQSVCIIHTVWATRNYDSSAEEKKLMYLVSFPFQFQAGIGMEIETLYYKVQVGCLHDKIVDYNFLITKTLPSMNILFDFKVQSCVLRQPARHPFIICVCDVSFISRPVLPMCKQAIQSRVWPGQR